MNLCENAESQIRSNETAVVALGAKGTERAPEIDGRIYGKPMRRTRFSKRGSARRLLNSG